MELKIDFSNPVFSLEEALAITTEDLNAFYSNATQTDRLNLYFQLEATLHALEASGASAAAAHVSFLMAYYLFVPLTPPASCQLALHYIRKAITLDSQPDYCRWLDLIEKGN